MKSEYMGILNKARVAVRNGKLEKGRFNRAFGLLQKNDFIEVVNKYNTTLSSCDCPDSRARKTICKHRIAMMVLYRYDYKEYESLVAFRKIYCWNNGYYIIDQELCGWRTHYFYDRQQAINFTKRASTVRRLQGKGRRLRDVYGE